jgi:translation initiation factor 5B
MAPKKKAGKKAQDDWENELGDAMDPIAEATKRATTEEAAKDAAEEDDMSGGILAALRKNRAKKAKKGKHVEDFVEGEDPTADNDAPAPAPLYLAAKAPEEATMDGEDVFGQPDKKGKGAKGKGKIEKADDAPEDVELHDDGRVKTKKEKEKEKKEREKQRKKEQVSFNCPFSPVCWPNKYVGCKEEASCSRGSPHHTSEDDPEGRTETRTQARINHFGSCWKEEEGQCGSRRYSEAAGGAEEAKGGEGEITGGGESSHRGRRTSRSRRFEAQRRDQSCEKASRKAKS